MALFNQKENKSRIEIEFISLFLEVSTSLIVTETLTKLRNAVKKKIELLTRSIL